MIDFNKIVNKLGKKEGNVMSIEDIGVIIDPDINVEGKGVSPAIYKAIYRLRANGILQPIRNGLYYVSNGKNINEPDIIDSQYWKILKKIIQDVSRGEYYIGGNKSLEILLKDYSIPNKVIVYSKDIQKNVQISSSHVVSFRRITSGKKSGAKNIFTELKKHTKSLDVDGVKLRISGEELSLLDGFFVRDNGDGIDTYLLSKYIKKFGKILDREILGKLVSLKYITSINRLREYARDHGEEKLYAIALDIVKMEGGNCFLTCKK